MLTNNVFWSCYSQWHRPCTCHLPWRKSAVKLVGTSASFVNTAFEQKFILCFWLKFTCAAAVLRPRINSLVRLLASSTVFIVSSLCPKSLLLPWAPWLRFVKSRALCFHSCRRWLSEMQKLANLLENLLFKLASLINWTCVVQKVCVCTKGTSCLLTKYIHSNQSFFISFHFANPNLTITSISYLRKNLYENIKFQSSRGAFLALRDARDLRTARLHLVSCYVYLN